MLLLIQTFLRALTQDQKEQIDSEPLLWHWYETLKSNPTQHQFALFFWHATYPGTPLEDMPLLKDAKFIAQVEQAMGKEEVEIWNLCGRGSIWDFTGVQRPEQHIQINGTLRPVITWKK